MNTHEDGVGQERGRTTRREIIDVARRLFSEHGYHSTGIADIQAATGLTKGAFYHHFRSKEEVALAAVQAARADYAALWSGPAMQQERPVDRLEACLERVIELNERPEWRNCRMMAMLSAEASGADTRLREAVAGLRNEAVQAWQTLIADAQQASQVSRAVNAGVAAEWIVSTIVGSLLAQKLGVNESETRNVVNAMKRVLIKGRRRK